MLVRICCAIALASTLAPRAWADRAPTAAQLERAKKAFADGKRLHDAGKLTEAIEKFKRSYELSNNPLLLYNIGVTMEELGADNLDLAVVFYRRFLAEAPADAGQRQDATDRIAAITGKLSPPVIATEPPPAPAPPTPAPPAPAPPPPAPTYGPADFTHHAVEAAPPATPLDITAAAPEAAGFAVTLFFRGAGEATFASTPMRRRGGELVARIPAARLTGRAIQYYLEVRDPAGTVITRAGKSTSPNVITLDAGVPPRFYPDVTEGPITQPPPPAATPPTRSDDTEDPIARGAGDADAPRGPSGLTIARWSTTAGAGVGVGLGITFYLLARGHANALQDDAAACGAPPCQQYDEFDRGLQHTGKLEQTIANVALVAGAASAAVAGYLWIRELTDRSDARSDARSDVRSHTTRRSRAQPTWVVAPTRGPDGYTGAAAAVRF